MMTLLETHSTRKDSLVKQSGTSIKTSSKTPAPSVCGGDRVRISMFRFAHIDYCQSPPVFDFVFYTNSASPHDKANVIPSGVEKRKYNLFRLFASPRDLRRLHLRQR